MEDEQKLGAGRAAPRRHQPRLIDRSSEVRTIFYFIHIEFRVFCTISYGT